MGKIRFPAVSGLKRQWQGLSAFDAVNSGPYGI
jgi:hypothetical protein